MSDGEGHDGDTNLVLHVNKYLVKSFVEICDMMVKAGASVEAWPVLVLTCRNTQGTGIGTRAWGAQGGGTGFKHEISSYLLN